MRAWIIAAALAFAPAPALAQEADSVAHAAAAQNGGSVEAKQGGTLEIQLAVNPSTGAHWDVAEKPDFLGDASVSVAPQLVPGQRPRLGAPQMATITFGVNGAGSGDVALEMHGPGPGGPALQTFRVTVTAQ